MHKHAFFTRVGQRLRLAERKRRRVQLVEESALLRVSQRPPSPFLLVLREGNRLLSQR
jgi:hypothetical protein